MANEASAVGNLTARLDRLPITRSGLRFIVLLLLVWIIEGVDIGVIGTITVVLRAALHLNSAQLGMLGVSGTLGIVIGAIPAGILADRFGRKPVLVAGVTAFSVISFLTAFAPDLTVIVLLRFLTGLAEGAVFPLPYLILSELVPVRRRGAVVGYINGLLAFAYILPSLLGAWAVRTYAPDFAWRVPLLLTGIPVLYAGVLQVWMWESPRWLLRKGFIDRARALVELLEREAGVAPDPALQLADAAGRPPEVAAAGGRERVREFLSPPYVGRSAVVYSVYTGAFVFFYAVLAYGPVLLHAEGFSVGAALVAVALMNVGGGVGNIAAGHLGDALGRRRMLSLFASCAAVAAIVMGFVHSVAAVTLLGVIATFFGDGTFALTKVYLAEQYPTRIRGLGVAAGEMTGRFLGGVLAGYYIPAILAASSAPTVFLFSGVVMAAAVQPVLWRGRETARMDIDVAGEAALV
jgi:putative MFS transporter